MKIAKIAVSAAVASALIFGSTAVAKSSPSETPEPISTHVVKQDKKTVEKVRNLVTDLQDAKDQLAQSTDLSSANSAYKAALDAWKTANAAALAALDALKKTRKDATAAANAAYSDAKAAVKTAKAALEAATTSGDQTAIDSARQELAAVKSNLSNAKDVRDAAIKAANVAYKDAVAALGPLPDKPVKPKKADFQTASPEPSPTETKAKKDKKSESGKSNDSKGSGN